VRQLPGPTSKGDADASLGLFTRLFPINLGCSPGADGKIGLVDTCEGFVFEVAATAHVIDCDDVPPIP
jgi:hypothetical protein